MANKQPVFNFVIFSYFDTNKGGVNYNKTVTVNMMAVKNDH